MLLSMTPCQKDHFKNCWVMCLVTGRNSVSLAVHKELANQAGLKSVFSASVCGYNHPYVELIDVFTPFVEFK